MGNVIRIIGIFYFNIREFVKALFATKIYWQGNSIKIANCKIHPKTHVSYPAKLHEIDLGYGSYISVNSNISYTSIGKYCSLGPNIICGWGIHPLSGISTSPLFYSRKTPLGFSYSADDKLTQRKRITIGNDVFIGANVTILDGVNIGDGAVIGAGAVVSKDIPAYAIAVGCPIVIIKYRFETDTVKKLLALRWWDKDEREIALLERKFFNVEELVKDL